MLLTATGTAFGQWSAYSFDIHRAGLYDAGHTGSSGYQRSVQSSVLPSGHVVGYSYLVSGLSDYNGQSTWVYDPSTHVTTQTGLISSLHTGSAGYQQSVNSAAAGNGWIVGYSQRVTGLNQNNGQSTWLYNPLTNTTVQTGYTGAAYTGSGGYQVSGNDALNSSGQVAGYSERINGIATSNGRNTWVYNAISNATAQTGYVGPEYTGSSGYQSSFNSFQNAAGQVAGYSSQITGINTTNGQHSWVYQPGPGTTIRTGLIGSAHTGSAGAQTSFSTHQNDAGFVVGQSFRVANINSYNGENTWAFNPATGVSTPIGLTGSEYTGTNGYQSTRSTFLSPSGQIAGNSQLILGTNSGNGQRTWVYSPLTDTSVQTGLTGAEQTGTAGFQYSVNESQSASGFVAGYSVRFAANGSGGGANTWSYNPATDTTVQTGLLTPIHTGANGEQFSLNVAHNEQGRVAGTSARYDAAGFGNGANAWAFNPQTGTSTPIGLTGPAHTGNQGYQFSTVFSQNVLGRIIGSSQRVLDASTDNGQDTWSYNPLTGESVQTGLTGPSHTSPTGYRLSNNSTQNNTGYAAGYSIRLDGPGEDVWYFDPVTGNTYQPTLEPMTIGNSADYAYSRATLLTDSGFLFGWYSSTADGDLPAPKFAYIYRPDLGFSELGALVDGGLSAAGWDSLQRAEYASAMDFIVGYGLATGQGAGSQSIFVMTAIPAPGAAVMIALGGLVAARRRRRCIGL